MIVGLCAFMYWLMCHIDAFFTLFLKSYHPHQAQGRGWEVLTGEGKVPGMMGIYLDPAEAEAEEVKKEGRARLVSKKVIIPLLATITSLNKEKQAFQ
jgi:hypothetical protein